MSSNVEKEVKEAILSYQNAVWEFLLEHCEIMESGALFFKFHAKGRQNVENRIKSRWIYKYHREDVVAKEQVHIEKQTVFKETKAMKLERYKKNREKGKEALKKARVKNFFRRILKFIKNDRPRT